MYYVMKKNLLLTLSVWLLTACNVSVDLPVVSSDSDLQFPDLAKTWDEGMPLGNATVGALVWQRDSALRFSLDRTDRGCIKAESGYEVGGNVFVCGDARRGQSLVVWAIAEGRACANRLHPKYRERRWSSRWKNWGLRLMFICI